MQESTTSSLDPSLSLQLERDRVKVQEKIKNIYDNKTKPKPSILNSITKMEFLPTVYDVPSPSFLFDSPIIEGARGRSKGRSKSKGGESKSKSKAKAKSKGGGAKASNNKTKKDQPKTNNKADAAKSKLKGPMQRISQYIKDFFLHFSKILTNRDRNQMSATVKQNDLFNIKSVKEPSNIIPNGTPAPTSSTAVETETNTKTKQELKLEPKETFETIENMSNSKNKDNQKLSGLTAFDKHNADILYGIVYEFILLCFCFVITYNIYYFSFIYKWDVKTAHYDPEQGFMFGGVFKSMIDDWLMRDIRYPMLFMGYFYSWLIPGFFNLIGVLRYPKLCFIIILLHTMVIAFTQGANAAMSVDHLLGGSPMSFVLVLNVLSCLGAFFNTSLTTENALAWIRFCVLLIPSLIANLIRFVIAICGVFISQIMIYFFFIYTTSGLGLLWESQIFGIGDTIAEINNHIDGKSSTDKNYCKEEDKASALWEFINQKIEPHFSHLFIYLCIVFVAVKVIIVLFNFNGFFAKIVLSIMIIGFVGVVIWIINQITGYINGSDKNTNTVLVSTKDIISGLDKAKAWAQKNSDSRKEGLTRLSNEGNQMLSKAIGQPLRDIKNKLSNNTISNTLMGDNTFSALLPEDKKNLQEITRYLNNIMTNIDFSKDKDGKQAEEDVKSLLTNNIDMYKPFKNILQQPHIQQHIANRIGKGKRMPEIVQHMFQFILAQSGANPKVSDLVSNILSYKMDYGSEEDGKPINLNEVTLDLNEDDLLATPSSPATPAPAVTHVTPATPAQAATDADRMGRERFQ
jgi:hypothetical protein